MGFQSFKALDIARNSCRISKYLAAIDVWHSKSMPMNPLQNISFTRYGDSYCMQGNMGIFHSVNSPLFYLGNRRCKIMLRRKTELILHRSHYHQSFEASCSMISLFDLTLRDWRASILYEKNRKFLFMILRVEDFRSQDAAKTPRTDDQMCF